MRLPMLSFGTIYHPLMALSCFTNPESLNNLKRRKPSSTSGIGIPSAPLILSVRNDMFLGRGAFKGTSSKPAGLNEITIQIEHLGELHRKIEFAARLGS